MGRLISTECAQVLAFVPPRLLRFAKDILWVAIALLAVTGHSPLQRILRQLHRGR